MRRLLHSSLLAMALAVLFAAPSLAAPQQPAPVGKKKRTKRTTTSIEWTIEPAKVVVYVDGKELGRAGSLKTTKHKPGRHTVRLVNGADETEMDIELKKGTTLKFAFVFDEG